MFKIKEVSVYEGVPYERPPRYTNTSKTNYPNKAL